MAPIVTFLVLLLTALTLTAQDESQSLLHSTQEVAEKLPAFKMACKKLKINTLQRYLKQQPYKDLLKIISTQEYAALYQDLKNNYYTDYDALYIGYKTGGAAAIGVWTVAIATGLTTYASTFFMSDEENLQTAVTIQKYCLGTVFLNCVAYPLLGATAAGATALRNCYAKNKNKKITKLLEEMTALRQQHTRTVRMQPMINYPENV